MSDNDKNLELSNSSFEVKIRWKGGLFSTQIAILLGLGALYICSNSPTIHHLIGLALAIDVMAGVFTIVTSVRHSDDKEETDAKGNEKPADKPEAAEVTHTKAKKSSVSKSDKQISRKVPVPNPNAARTHGSHVAAPQSEHEEPQPMPIPQPETKPQQSEPAPVPATSNVETTEMAEDDWEGFF